MKRVLFYSLLTVQSVILVILGIQYYLIDDYGTEITLLKDEYMDRMPYSDHVYVDYEINFISKDNWEVTEDLERNERVYVLLEADESGIYHVKKVTNKKISPNQEQQTVLKGKYQYYNNYDHLRPAYYYVTYGIENMKYNRDTLNEHAITIKQSPWGELKVMEN